jgi:hypothetical protein
MHCWPVQGRRTQPSRHLPEAGATLLIRFGRPTRLEPNFDADSTLILIMAFTWSQLPTNQVDDEAAVEPVMKLIFTCDLR